MSETLAACLTPPGVSAIAVIGVRGPRALAVVEPLFVPNPPARQGHFHLGKFGEEAKDEVVLVVKEMAPVPALELHCHGGREVVRMILDALEARGVRRCSWEDWLRQVEPSPRAEAAILLAKATTVRTASILLDQHHGACERELAEIRTALDRNDLADARRRLQALTGRVPLGRHLAEPWRVVVAGAPNVGKSSLVNALAGYERCIVTATPGTTRDLVSTRLAIDGWPIDLIDTAGLRCESAGLEAAGIGLAQATVASADLVLWVLDGSVEPVWPAETGDQLLLVINKIDLPAAWDFSQARQAVPVSAKTGQGLDLLCQAISGRLVAEPPAPGAGVPFTDRLRGLVTASLAALAAGKPGECGRIRHSDDP